jgi:hypothetical protein
MANATLSYDVFARDRNASKTFDKVAGKASGFGKILGKVGKVGALGLAAIGAGAIAAAPKILDMASNLELMDQKAKTVFGGQIGKVKTWAEANAHAMGLTSRQATGLAANFADLLIPMKFSREEAAKMSTDVIGLSGALSQWSDGTRSAAEVAEILSSAMLGERDALKGLGISISEADVAARLAKKGQDDLTGSALAQAEAITTQELIFEKSGDAQKAYADRQGTLASKVAEAKASLGEMAETLLVKATPALKGMADVITGDVIPALTDFDTWVTTADQGMLGAADNFLAFADVLLTLDSTILGFVSRGVKNILLFGDVVTTAFVKIFGWVPGLGDKLRDAEKNFQGFRDGVNDSLDKAIDKTNQWDNSVDRMRKEIKIKGDINDLQQKLNTAKGELKDKDLTKERKAQIRADIRQLQGALAAARNALASLHDKTVTVTMAIVGSRGFRTGNPEATRRQHGGPVFPGRAYIVGETRPEVFVPREPGRIIPSISRVHGAAMTATADTVGPLDLSPKTIRALINGISGTMLASLGAANVRSARNADLYARAG